MVYGALTPRPFLASLWGQNYFQSYYAFCLFHHVDIYTANAEAVVDKIAGALAQIKAVAPDCTNRHCMLPLGAFAI